MKIDTLDLSFSGIVDILQGDKQQANRMLEILLTGIEVKKLEIKALEDKLLSEKSNLNYYLGGVEKICKHVQYKGPLSFVFGNKIYAVNEKLEVKSFLVTNIE